MTKKTKKSNWKLVFIIFISIITLTLSIISFISVQQQKQAIDKVNKKIENYIVTNNEDDKNILKSNAYIEFCETINNRADNAINELLTIVGIFASVMTLLGVLITFKAPKDLENEIFELRELMNKTHNIVEEQEYLLSLSDAIKEKTIYHRIKALTGVINKHPSKWQAYLYRGGEYSDKKEYAKAINDYNLAKSFGCDEETYYNNMSIALSERYKITNHKVDQEQALVYISKAISINEEDPMYYNNRGIIYAEMSNYEKADKDFDTALSLDSENYESYANKASLYIEISENAETDDIENEYKEKAINAIHRALELNSEDSYNLKRLNQLLKEKLFNEKSENEIDIKKDVDKVNVDDIISIIDEKIGDIESNDENYAEAITNYTDALTKYSTISDIVIDDHLPIIDRLCDKIHKCKEKMPSIDITDSIYRKLHFLIIRLTSLAYESYENNDLPKAGKIFEYATILNGLGSAASNNLAYMIRRGEYVCERFKINDLLSCKTPEESSSFLRINRALCMIQGIGFEKNVSQALREIHLCDLDLTSAIKWWSNEDVVGPIESNLVLLLLSIMDKKELVLEDKDIQNLIEQAISNGYDLPENIQEIANEILNNTTPEDSNDNT